MNRKVPSLSYSEASILQQMGCTVFIRPSHVWLDSKSPNLNRTIGSKKLGAAAGKMYEVAGKKHSGKTSLVMMLGAEAQAQCNAFVLWIDAESSLDNELDSLTEYKNSWADKFGLNTTPDTFYRVYPKILTRKKGRKKGKKITKAGDQFIQSAEFLFEEAELVIKRVKAENPDRPIFVAVDSIANLMTESAVDAGNTEKNMRTQLDRAMFLSNALPRWLTIISNYTAWMFLINQIRTNPAIMFGDSEYSPGGKALEHNCHSQIRMRPFKKGVIMDGDTVVGIRGTITNIKNKVGGGSLQSQRCGYAVDFSKQGRKMWKFMPVENLKGE